MHWCVYLFVHACGCACMCVAYKISYNIMYYYTQYCTMSSTNHYHPPPALVPPEALCLTLAPSGGLSTRLVRAASRQITPCRRTTGTLHRTERGGETACWIQTRSTSLWRRSLRLAAAPTPRVSVRDIHTQCNTS